MAIMDDPFADSKAQPQSFDSNPFADPSIQQGLHSNRHEYDLESAPSYDDLTNTKPPVAPQRDEMSSRFDDLARREQELANREAALANRAEHIRKHGRNNWPPGPFPLIFHDINQEIPEQHRSTILTLYRLWMFLVVVLIWNFVAAVLLLVSGASNGGADLGAAIMYIPVIGILSFLTWYRPAYNGYMKEASLFYYFYFLFAGFHIAFSVYAFIGIPSSGCAGLINLIKEFISGHIVAGVFCVIATVGWAIQGLGSIWMYKQIWAHSHGEQGHTFAQAKAEITQHGIKAYLFRSSFTS